MRKVLIVDDDPEVLATFARMLHLERYEVVTALDAKAALGAMESFHPDVVLVDLRMPMMGAVEFLKCIRAQNGHADTPVAVLTGDYFVDDLTRHALHDLESDLYFKPVWLEDLVEITARLLARLK